MKTSSCTISAAASTSRSGRRRWVLAIACLLVLTHAPRAQERASQTPQDQPDRIRVGVNLVTTSVTVRDGRGRFLADLKADEFELYEDGVRQTLVTFLLSHGGRVLDVTQPAVAAREGLLLPPSRPANDASGRIFLILIDDSHLEPSQTPRVRDLFNRITKRLIHQGDLFGIISTGPSSIEVELTHDRKRLDQAAGKIMGSGLSPSTYSRRRAAAPASELPLDYSRKGKKTDFGGMVKDAGEGGILVFLPEKIEVGEVLKVEIFFGKGLELNTVQGTAKIVWADLAAKETWREHRYGLEFQTMPKGMVHKLKNLLKDMDLVQDTAKILNLSLPVSELSRQLYRQANNQGYSELDYTGIISYYQKINEME